MGKARKIGIKSTYVPNAKADMRRRKGRIRYHAAEAVYEKNFREPAFGRDVFVSREAAARKLKEARDGTS